MGTKQTVAEVEARSSKPQRLSPSFISPPYYQINRHSLSLYPRESSRPVMNSVKKKISSEEKLSEDPPAFPSAWPKGEAGPTSEADAAPAISGPPKGAVHQLTFPSRGTLLSVPTYFSE